jgi:hypothetical protein
MIPIVERSIERGHRLTTLATKRAPHHSPAFVSCALRTREIEQHIAADPQFLQMLAAHCKSVRNPKHGSIAVHLQHHPLLLPLQSRFRRSQFRKQLVLLTYRCDPREQYERYPLFDKCIRKRREMLAKGHTQRAQQPQDVGGGADHIRAKYAMMHLQSVLVNGVLLTIPDKHASALWTLSDSMLHSAPMKYKDVDEVDIDSHMLDVAAHDQHEDDVVGSSGSGASVFRVVHLRPSQQRYIHSAGFSLSSTSIAMCKVNVRTPQDDTSVLSVVLEPDFSCMDDSTFILSATDIAGAGVDVACESFVQWQEDGHIEYSMSELPDDADRCIAEVLLHTLAIAAAAGGAGGTYHNERGLGPRVCCAIAVR